MSQLLSFRPPFPAVIDSSLIAAFRACGGKAWLEYFHHFKGKTPNVHLHAGGAYAAGLEAARTAYYVHGVEPETAIRTGLKALLIFYGDFECPPESAKSFNRTAGALEFYFSRYPLGEDTAVPLELPGGKRGIEFSFCEPLSVLHPETGDPLLYAGRMDMVCTYNGLTLGEDDKTTSSLGASWPGQWDLRSQFTGYVWGALKNQLRLDGFLVRGVSILKTKYDTLETVTYRPQWQLDRWEKQLYRDVARMVESWKTGEWDWTLDHACEDYGGCPFKRVCLMKDPELLLEAHYERRRWDPVTRVETPLPLEWQGETV